jgi:hypothetical protein
LRGLCGCNLVTPRFSAATAQFRQLGDVGGDAAGFVLGEQIGGSAASRLFLKIDVGQCMPVLVADAEAGIVGLFDSPRWREAA